MAEVTTTMTYCDRCNPERSTEDVDGEGLFDRWGVVGFRMLKYHGWRLIDGKHVCPACQTTEKDNG